MDSKEPAAGLELDLSSVYLPVHSYTFMKITTRKAQITYGYLRADSTFAAQSKVVINLHLVWRQFIACFLHPFENTICSRMNKIQTS